MNNKGVSFILFSHDNRFFFRRYLSPSALKLLFAALTVLFGLVVFLAVSYVPVYYRALQVEYFSRRNKEIEQDFRALSELKSELGFMRRENMKIRQMLGIEQTPPPISLDNTISSYIPGSRSGIADAASAGKVPSVTPVIGIVSNDYDLEHKAVDIAAALGSIVIAPAEGLVEKAGWDSVYGNYLVLKHNDLYSTFFGHLNSVEVMPGAKVSKNDIIAHVGSSGRSTAPHLHYVVLFKVEPIDPKPYMN